MRRPRSALIGLLAFGLVVASDVAYFAIIYVFGVDPQAPSAVNAVFRMLTIWMPAVAFWVAAALATTRRMPVILAALAVTSWASGALIYNLLKGSNADVPSPAPSDIGYLAFYAFMVAAFIALGSILTRRAMVPVALEAVIASLGTASVLLVLVQPLLDEATRRSDTLERPLTLIYPLLDVVLVAITAGFASNPAVTATRRIWWFVAGIAVFVATDLAYALLSEGGDYRAGNWIDGGWPIGLALLAWWALGFIDSAPKLTTSNSTTALGLIAPVFSVVAAIGVLVYASQRPVHIVAVVLATVTVGLTAIPVLTRQTLLSRVVNGQTRVLSELRELDESKSEMITTLNHEMRTPLTSILGYLEIVRDGGGGDIPREADEMLGAVEHSARRLHSIVDEMLILTRLDSHDLGVEMEPVNVGDIASRVVSQLAPIAEGRGVLLQLHLDENAPLVLGDDSRLGHALTTVAENAVKFTPNRGSVTVSVTVRKHLRPVVVTVTDTGMGVPADDLPRLFERFFRATNATQSAVGGSGLGLSIARGIVELHGGRIRAESVLGEGTTMIITLPSAD
ncbi:cell wall metabolism sensor histidine kinase WalK [Glaciihabitans sp. dw_435]|uniref:sensor histidine kinase n=1 Tax=Glaciihabitans sp. dw_435 TaxID=2720081 RepID=UPI001BD4A404|nr:HAMP domain-containing sensor histidine kinase [Glaciihabitans sp. dw_435]